MSRQFFIFSLLSLFLSSLCALAIELEEKSRSFAQESATLRNMECANWHAAAGALAVQTSVVHCVQKSYEHQTAPRLFPKTAPVAIDFVISALPTRVWSNRNYWYEMVQALCKPTQLKEVLNPVAQLRQVQRKYQAGAYHWRPSQALQRRTAFSH